ncbi:SMP-30/gluconolactonase/LRE family protein [uncultured Sphingomonas sp.]|uniref:SMP-30/gluconolactonase/LRE family protein n=1 Tax=uncultured Sphingomonas sp. TaxID=158754 RepID=UPI00258C9794|nr:SMP-30/gluconolactonase/LRE family protein [uncultured Sphingomonas sp.]
MVDRARMVWNGAAELGEGPVWEARDAALWFVDIKRPAVHRVDPADGTHRSWPAPAQIGWVLPAEGGGFLAGLQTGLAHFDPATGAFTHLCAVEPDRPGNRLNDATVGPDGVVWFGSMDDAACDATGQVHRWDGARATVTGIAPVKITNGPAVSPDGSTLYHVDTLGGAIHAVPVTGDGTTGAGRVLVTIDPADGTPDGVSTDAAGNIWLGMWGGWCARCYDPAGTLLREVRLPAAQVTKIAFGGADLRTAFATSARLGLDAAALAAQPEAGAVFAFDVDVPGRPLPLARLRR